ncbi:MAG: type II secretion system protein GspN [Candidatus Dadabacteria bacterium]|nr:type II secretion system protein GspN [Candidatus Dadabacteria bacterium]MYA48995.1 type II secretion system protein GspN [Candidatus Dadabacteria bacterium]MYG82597.1 type II secretion system protein GspN [Candidatus Dadabacteria bacterium]MYK49504.1 type II secretion system protein GspN [Candidatus Dadabacteria bacterium]
MNIRNRIKIPGKISVSAYVGIFLVSLLAFLLLGFPWDSVERRVAFEIQSNSPVPVLIGSTDLKGLSSVELNDVRVLLGDRGTLVIDRARVSAGLFSVIFSDDARVSFSVDAYGGKIDGKVSQNKKKNKVTSAEVDVNSVESSTVSRLFLEGKGISLSGKVDGSVKFLGEGESGGISKMEYLVSSPSLSVGVEEVRGFKVKEEYKNLSVVLRGTANRFESRVERFSLTNPRLSLEAEGKAPSPLRFRKGAALDLSVTFRPSPDDKKLALVGGFLSPRGDGSFSGRIQGTLSKPRIVSPDGGG